MPARPLSALAALVAAALLAACATPPGGRPPAPGAPAVPAREPTLAEEQRRLQRLFDGTPVAIELMADGRLRVAVPLAFSFDPGRAAVKPALGKVLEHVARGVRQQRSTEMRVAAPADPRGAPRLAAERAASTRDYLVAQGVPLARIASAEPGEGAGVEIVVVERR